KKSSQQRQHWTCVTNPVNSRRRTSGLQPHPDSGLVPGMARDEYQAFLADIAARGIQTPLAITQGDIVLDGHQRLRAAIELGHDTVPVTLVEADDEIEYMLL